MNILIISLLVTIIAVVGIYFLRPRIPKQVYLVEMHHYPFIGDSYYGEREVVYLTFSEEEVKEQVEIRNSNARSDERFYYYSYEINK